MSKTTYKKRKTGPSAAEKKEKDFMKLCITIKTKIEAVRQIEEGSTLRLTLNIPSSSPEDATLEVRQATIKALMRAMNTNKTLQLVLTFLLGKELYELMHTLPKGERAAALTLIGWKPTTANNHIKFYKLVAAYPCLLHSGVSFSRLHRNKERLIQYMDTEGDFFMIDCEIFEIIVGDTIIWSASDVLQSGDIDISFIDEENGDDEKDDDVEEGDGEEGEMSE